MPSRPEMTTTTRLRRSISRSSGSSSRSRPCCIQRHLLAVLLLVVVAVAPLHAQAPPTSTTTAMLDCFATLGAMNSAMELELIRIRNGAVPQTTYVYPLCPNTVLDATTTPLRPLLNNAMFVCGADGQRSNRCVILGGTVQVAILDSLVDGYPLQEVSFLGLTFSGFVSDTSAAAAGIGTSIAAMASSVTMATFTDCLWQVRACNTHDVTCSRESCTVTQTWFSLYALRHVFSCDLCMCAQTHHRILPVTLSCNKMRPKAFWDP
jgi:hypothetical protein